MPACIKYCILTTIYYYKMVINYNYLANSISKRGIPIHETDTELPY